MIWFLVTVGLMVISSVIGFLCAQYQESTYMSFWVFLSARFKEAMK